MIHSPLQPLLAEPVLKTALRVNPFLHDGGDRLYDPLTDRTLLDGESGYAALRALLAGGTPLSGLPEADRAGLAAQGWLLPAEEDPSRRFLLKYVSLEALTVGSHSC